MTRHKYVTPLQLQVVTVICLQRIGNWVYQWTIFNKALDYCSLNELEIDYP